ncbi:hypothetical protein PHYBOEH_009867 [Phytophthora boehmeriae]|uniref:Uncharacterized protein n=1 Tax=Phytophthora boehmeriae TaxID=109152 RepID=A0A8T1VU69_9STRA|nr:hypothetical protein PHYBOEH_009867 [Phytophthora boehmeriae]
MLGFQYVVAKSRELSSALDRELSAAGGRSAPFSSVSSTPSVENASSTSKSEAPEAPQSTVPARNEGSTFLRVQQEQQAHMVANHQRLLSSGQALSAALGRARATLQAQAASEQFLTQNFHLVARVRQQLAGVRALVLKVAEDAEDVENLLVQRCEETAARQNAAFAAQQQQELEAFEATIAQESEGRKRELLERRRQKLASAFMNDLRTYQTLIGHHGDAAAAEASAVSNAKAQESLDSIDLVVVADPDQLAAFYESGSEQDEDKEKTPKFSSPTAPTELLDEEEEKDDADDDGDEGTEETVAQTAGIAEVPASEEGDDETEEIKGVGAMEGDKAGESEEEKMTEEEKKSA